MQHRAASEVLAGHVLLNKLNAEVVDPGILESPFDSLVKMLQEGAKEIDIVDSVGMHALAVAKDASRNAPGDPYSFIKICEVAASRTAAGRKLRPIVEQLERGEHVDAARILSAAAVLENGYRDFTPASEIEPEAQIYVPSYYPPLDRFVGGYPQAGLTIVAGITGTGKTTFLIELARRAALRRKYCGILTLEMTNGQIVYRMLEIDPELQDGNKRKYILLSDDVYSVDEAYAAASRLAAQHKLHFIGIDYADMLVGQKEQSEAVMGRIYNSLSVLAKKVRLPVILVAQYRRTNGMVPTIEDIRYSGRAEQAASMILLLYNQDMVWARSMMDKENNPLPYSPGSAWIVVGKTRYKGKQPTGLGAIKVEWDEMQGKWGDAVGRDPWFDMRGKV